MVGECESCQCPFCARRRHSLAVMPGLGTGEIAGGWLLWLLLVLLLSGETLARPDNAPSGYSFPRLPKSIALFSQKVHLNSSTDTECGENCYCTPTGKCKPCSRFEIGRQVTECLLTGYKQSAYCPKHKKEQYISCHYEPDPEGTRRFWIFEVLTILTFSVSYSVVFLRQRRIEKMVHKRIQQQINA